MWPRRASGGRPALKRCAHWQRPPGEGDCSFHKEESASAKTAPGARTVPPPKPAAVGGLKRPRGQAAADWPRGRLAPRRPPTPPPAGELCAGPGRAGFAAATAGQLTPAAPAEEGEAGRRARFPVRPRCLLGGGVALSFCYVAAPLPSLAEGRGPSSPFAEAKHPPAHRHSARPPAPVLTVRLASGPGRAEGLFLLLPLRERTLSRWVEPGPGYFGSFFACSSRFPAEFPLGFPYVINNNSYHFLSTLYQAGALHIYFYISEHFCSYH